MNQSVNKIILVGNIGNKTNLFHMKNNIDVINLSVATTESWKNKDTGNYDSKTIWHKVSVFGKLAKYLEKVSVGTKVYIEGSLKYNTWNDKDGNARTSCEIVVNYGGKVIILNNKNNIKIEKQNIDKINEDEKLNFSDDDDIDFDLSDDINL